MISATHTRHSSCLSLAQMRPLLGGEGGWWREIGQEKGELESVVFQGAKGPESSWMSHS